MRRILSTAALAAILAGAAIAESTNTSATDGTGVAPAFAKIGGDWTGPYAGLQLGNVDVDGTGAADGDDVLFGVHFGYDYDFGQFVLGGEVDYDKTDVDLSGAGTIDSIARLKLRAGYDIGPVLVYFTAGAAEVNTSLGSETGEFYGLGLNYRVRDNFTVGGEILEHNFDDINGSGLDADATTVTIRGSFRF